MARIVIRLWASLARCQRAASRAQWNFNWQLNYCYSSTVEIGPEDSLRVTCVYDTTTAKQPMKAGEGTEDEMCIGSFFAYVTAKKP